MVGFLMRKRHLWIAALAVSFAGFSCASAYGQKPKVTKVKPQATKKQDGAESAEPDKVLYDRAMNDIKHKRYTEARLSLQTLINTYPDSEYLAKAKLGSADSYYNEGGTSNLTQAVEEYKNFIVFFPFLDEAAYAQMQVGMAHYRMMEKSDRDNSQAEAAEDEFQAFLLKYPQSPLAPKAAQHLRDVQEVVADGEFRVAHFYYAKRDFAASAARLFELTERYPLYSQSDIALAMLGDVYMRAKQVSKNEDDKNHWADLAAKCYGRILEDYPLSRLAPQAKEHLKLLGMPIPAADPGAVARMKKQQMFEEQHHQNFALKFPLGMVQSRPDVSTAARFGEPNLNPPDDSTSAREILRPGAAGPSFEVAAQMPAAANDGGADSSTVTGGPVIEGGTSESMSNSPARAVGAEIIAAPTTSPAESASPSTASANPSTASSVATAAATTPNPTQGDVPAQTVSQDAASPAQTAPTAATNGTTQANAQPAANQSNPKSESTSKKKKGLKKLIPF
jgi:outer membrane protein assembly factor BamD